MAKWLRGKCLLAKWIGLGIYLMAGNVFAGVVDEVPMFKLVDGKKEPFKLPVETKYVAYYFSASWCPPCRKTTPPLVEEYQRMLDAEGMPIEVVLVSGDRSEDDMLRYMKNYGMKWPAVQRGSEPLLDDYAASGIPHLVLVKRKSGDVLVDGTGPSEIEDAVKEMRGYSGVEGDFQIGSWMERYGILLAVFITGFGILILKNLRQRRSRE